MRTAQRKLLRFIMPVARKGGRRTTRRDTVHHRQRVRSERRYVVEAIASEKPVAVRKGPIHPHIEGIAILGKVRTVGKVITCARGCWRGIQRKVIQCNRIQLAWCEDRAADI